MTRFCPQRASICMLWADGTREGNEGLFCFLIEGDYGHNTKKKKMRERENDIFMM